MDGHTHPTTYGYDTGMYFFLLQFDELKSGDFCEDSSSEHPSVLLWDSFYFEKQRLRLISSVSHCGHLDHIEQDFPHAVNVVLAHNVTCVTNSAFHIPPLEGC